MKRLIAYLLTVSMLLCCCGCSASEPQPADPTVEPTRSTQQTKLTFFMSPIETYLADLDVPLYRGDTKAIEKHRQTLMDFSLDLLGTMHSGGNTAFSPASVLFALGMTANGAEGQTLMQIEDALGVSRQDLNDYLSAYTALLKDQRSTKLNLANSVWYTNNPNFEIQDAFLQQSTLLFDAEIFPAAFDETTAQEINDWIRKETEGAIPQIIDELDPFAVAYLINAFSFSGSWYNSYKGTVSSTFRTEDGADVPVEVMDKNEEIYLEGDNATGFMKLYSDGRYAFAAILPEKGVTIRDFLEDLDGDDLEELLCSARDENVYVVIPRFKAEFSTDLALPLQQLGITNAFHEEIAELSGLGSMNGSSPYIGSILHRTILEVDEKGSTAAASTAAMMAWYCAPEISLYFERPFVYMIVDTATFTPLFMGVMMDPSIGFSSDG